MINKQNLERTLIDIPTGNILYTFYKSFNIYYIKGADRERCRRTDAFVEAAAENNEKLVITLYKSIYIHYLKLKYILIYFSLEKGFHINDTHELLGYSALHVSGNFKMYKNLKNLIRIYLVLFGHSKLVKWILKQKEVNVNNINKKGIFLL